jgi:DNA-binding response OmpR family regulator
MAELRKPQADILIVDDTPANLNVLSTILTQQGYKVRPANNGEVALVVAQRAAPDLILLDIQMPGMNGFEVCQRLKESDQTRDIPVIFISALDEVLDKVEAFEVGGVDYITKPFQILEVLARIEHQLRLRRQQEQIAAVNLLAHDLLASIQQLVGPAQLLAAGGQVAVSAELRTGMHQAAQKLEAAFQQMIQLTEQQLPPSN